LRSRLLLHVDAVPCVVRGLPTRWVAVRSLPALTRRALLRDTAALLISRAAVHALLCRKAHGRREVVVDIRGPVRVMRVLIVILDVVSPSRGGAVLQLAAHDSLTARASAALAITSPSATALRMFWEAALRVLHVHVEVICVLPARLNAVAAFPALAVTWFESDAAALWIRGTALLALLHGETLGRRLARVNVCRSIRLVRVSTVVGLVRDDGPRTRTVLAQRPVVIAAVVVPLAFFAALAAVATLVAAASEVIAGCRRWR